MRIVSLIAFWIAAGIAAATAQDFSGPRQTVLHADWDAAKASLSASDVAAAATEPPQIDQLNSALSERFAGIAASPVPVLLPFDVGAYLRDRAADKAKPSEGYLSGFQSSGFFLAGPSGYDAVFSIKTSDVSEFGDIYFVEPIQVEISGFALTYDLPPPTGAIEMPARGLEAEFPGLRRLILESYLRYSFTRFGVRYVISIQCYDAAPRPRRLACKHADRIATRFMRALRLAGGTPAPDRKPIEPATIPRPAALSPDFTYYGPGKLLPNTGSKNHDGDVDYTVYSSIRYPLAQPPSFANSQSFMNWGDCDQTGRSPSPGGRKGARYRCRLNDKPLVFDESAVENYSYPWRDNFCEHRFFFVGQCGAGYGHQGQDIRPGSCSLRNDGADRCEPYRDAVVAVREGMILRARKQEGLFLVANGENERIRFRYMHMNPNRLDDDGMLSGRRTREGEVIGMLGNFNRKENGTTYHLHFEVMVPTNDGWVRVNPYMTLVSAYERLLGARGREIQDPEPQPKPAVASIAAEAPVVKRKPSKIEVSLQATKRHPHKRKRSRRH